MKGSDEDKLKLTFDIYDFNNDGSIERKEVEKIIKVRNIYLRNN